MACIHRLMNDEHLINCGGMNAGLYTHTFSYKCDADPGFLAMEVINTLKTIGFPTSDSVYNILKTWVKKYIHKIPYNYHAFSTANNIISLYSTGNTFMGWVINLAGLNYFDVVLEVKGENVYSKITTRSIQKLDEKNFPNKNLHQLMINGVKH